MNKLLIFLGAVALLGTFAFLAGHNKKDLALYMKDAADFQSWKSTFGKSYADYETEIYRFTVWKENNDMINNFSHPDFTLAMNQFGDITNEEFKKIYLGLLPETATPRGNRRVHEMIEAPANMTVDWVAAGAVTPIKNQGQCGSCWSFSATGGMEGDFAIFGPKQTPILSFSEQQLVSCSSSYGNQGCNGGLMDYAFQYVEAQGINTESTYPYTSGNGVTGTCKMNTGPYFISGYTDIPSGNCNSLASALQTRPVSVGVDAESWQFYSSGILSVCGKTLDHGVLLVGMASNYWYVKNSWGTTWGEAGFIQLARGNTCGICNTASYPTGVSK